MSRVLDGASRPRGAAPPVLAHHLTADEQLQELQHAHHGVGLALGHEHDDDRQSVGAHPGHASEDDAGADHHNIVEEDNDDVEADDDAVASAGGPSAAVPQGPASVTGHGAEGAGAGKAASELDVWPHEDTSKRKRRRATFAGEFETKLLQIVTENDPWGALYGERGSSWQNIADKMNEYFQTREYSQINVKRHTTTLVEAYRETPENDARPHLKQAAMLYHRRQAAKEHKKRQRIFLRSDLRLTADESGGESSDSQSDSVRRRHADMDAEPTSASVAPPPSTLPPVSLTATAPSAVGAGAASAAPPVADLPPTPSGRPGGHATAGPLPPPAYAIQSSHSLSAALSELIRLQQSIQGLLERDQALRERELAVMERDTALRERDLALRETELEALNDKQAGLLDAIEQLQHLLRQQ